MAKDDKGHGSNTKGWGHEQHFAEAKRLLKDAGSHSDKRAAADMRVKAREHADEANYLRSKGQKTAYSKGSNTPEPKYNAGSVNKAIDSAYRGAKKQPTASQRAVTHSLLGGRISSTTKNRKY